MEIKLNKSVFDDGKLKDNKQVIKKIIIFMTEQLKANPNIKLPSVIVQWDGLFSYGEVPKSVESFLKKNANERNKSFDGLVHSLIEYYKDNIFKSEKRVSKDKAHNYLKLLLTREECNIFKDFAISDFTVEKHLNFSKTIKELLDNLTVEDLDKYQITKNSSNSLNLTYQENNEIISLCEEKFKDITRERVVSIAIKKHLSENIVGENFMGREERISVTASLTPEQIAKLNELRNSYFRIVPVTEHLISMALNGAINFDDYSSFEIPENTKNCAFNVLVSTDEKILSKMKEVKGRKIKFVTFLLDFVLSKDIETIKEYIQSRVHNPRAYTKKQQQEILNDKTFGEVEHPEQKAEVLKASPEAVKNGLIPKSKWLYMPLFIFIREKIESNLSDDEIFALFEPSYINNDIYLVPDEMKLKVKEIGKLALQYHILVAKENLESNRKISEEIEHLKEILEQKTELITASPEAVEWQREQFRIYRETNKEKDIKKLYSMAYNFLKGKIDNLSDDEIFALFKPNSFKDTFKIPSDFVLGESELHLKIKGISKAIIETCIKDIRKEKAEHIEYLKENEKKARTIFDLMYDSCKEEDDEKIKSLNNEEFLLTNEMMYLPFKGEQNIVNFCIREINSKATSNEKCYFYQNVIFRFLKEGFDITYTKINSPLEIAIETYNKQFTSIFIKDSYGKALNCRDKYGKPLSFKLIDNFEIHEINDILSLENISSPLGGGWLHDIPKEQYEGLNILHKFFSKMEKSPSFEVFYDVFIGLIIQKISSFPELLNIASVGSISPFAYLISQFAINKFNNIIHKCCVSWDDKTVIEYDFYEKLIIPIMQLAKKHKMKLFFPSRFTDYVNGKSIPIWKVKEVMSLVIENKECFDDDIMNRILSISDENGDFCDTYQDNSITKKIANLENNQGLNSFQSKQRKMISFKK